MALHDILVHVDGSEDGNASLDLAVALARQHQAHLTGLFVRDTMLVSAGAGALGYTNWQLVEALMQQLGDELRDAGAKAQAAFTERVAREGITGEWRSVEGPTPETVTKHARFADLCVLRQPKPGSAAESAYLDLAETVLFASGRPLLIDSYAASPARPLNNVLVAWNGTREAARAVNDALPILGSARTVTVLTVNPGGGPGEADLSASNMAQHLARHGVTATAMHTVATEIDVGNLLLNSISDTGADLLVMGGYGHTRAREMMLGGTTRLVLRHMTVSVLMSH